MDDNPYEPPTTTTTPTGERVGTERFHRADYVSAGSSFVVVFLLVLIILGGTVVGVLMPLSVSLLMSAVILLGIVVRVQTNYGTVRLEIPAGIANLAVTVDGETISVDGLGDPLQLRPGAHELVVTGKDYATVCTSFTVRRGHNPPVAVTLVEKPPFPGPPVF